MYQVFMYIFVMGIKIWSQNTLSTLYREMEVGLNKVYAQETNHKCNQALWWDLFNERSDVDPSNT